MKYVALLILSSFISLSVLADEKDQTKTIINLVSSDGVGASIGTIAFQDSSEGLILNVDLHGLTPGEHGFHIHENPSCEPGEKDGKKTAAIAAGAHYDPDHSGHHSGPAGVGHRGDLPKLIIDASGNIKARLIAPRIKLADILNRSVMIHAAGDNYSDLPAPLGGGGARIACGVIE